MGLAKAHASRPGLCCEAVLTPLYSMPHFSFTIMILPVSSFRKGFGLTGTVCRPQQWSSRRDVCKFSMNFVTQNLQVLTWAQQAPLPPIPLILLSAPLFTVCQRGG